MRRTVALLTDFGLKDGFVGAVKGVLLSINQDLNIIDISHEITSFDILEAAIVLNATYKYFPQNTIFMCVVDPGVGTSRKPIAVKTKDYYFVAPDNGLLTLALKNQQVEKIVHIKNYQLKTDTNTFHGRDIFAPASGYLSKGSSIEDLGEPIEDYQKISNIDPIEKDNKIIGKILTFDKFGNAITNLSYLPQNFKLYYKNYVISEVKNNFLEGDKDKPNLIKGSFGFYELFIPMDSFKEKFNATREEQILVEY
ncbi:SAM hydrolase/SAM-dependent halogenase family protein [Sulfurihydrogenibium subterraneum]|uniref:SAM hydrolase/SAM-dependent halogenase family protein n=1 Tax=Sulfurihydrogenibium subterraneum TaxID=171121 RepID=UPI00048BBF14|nr:SAM-dependent chlorinase/fluorinase [Sulfurihydrogenibium subterraneum]